MGEAFSYLMKVKHLLHVTRHTTHVISHLLYPSLGSTDVNQDVRHTRATADDGDEDADGTS